MWFINRAPKTILEIYTLLIFITLILILILYTDFFTKEVSVSYSYIISKRIIVGYHQFDYWNT